MTFDEHLGMQFEEGEGGREAKISIELHHCNPTGNINGGVIIALADNLSTGAASEAGGSR